MKAPILFFVQTNSFYCAAGIVSTEKYLMVSCCFILHIIWEYCSKEMLMLRHWILFTRSFLSSNRTGISK